MLLFYSSILFVAFLCCSISSRKLNVRLNSGHWYTVNDLINAHFQISASYRMHTASTLLKLYWTPLFNKRPYETRN